MALPITKQLVESFGASKTGRNRWCYNFRFFFHWNKQKGCSGCWYFGTDERWNHCHAVTHLEECFSFAFEDGERNGRQSMKDDLKALLEGEY